jgi:hypothetical protein
MSVFTTQHGDCCGNNLSWPLYGDLRDQTRSFSGITAFYPSMPTSIGGYGEAERVWGALAEYNFFDVTQLRISLGGASSGTRNNFPLSSSATAFGGVISLQTPALSVSLFRSPDIRSL